jgi:hypothetical protein
MQTTQWLPIRSQNYYGWQLSVGNIPENSQVWIGNNRSAILYRLASKLFHPEDQTYTLTFELDGTTMPPLKCHPNTTLSVKVLSALD